MCESQFLNYWPITRQKNLYNHFWRHMGDVFTKELSIKLSCTEWHVECMYVHFKIFNIKLKFLRLFHIPQKNDAIVPRSFYCSINKLPTIFVEMGGSKLPCKGSTRPRAAICRLWTKDNRYDKTFFTVFHVARSTIVVFFVVGANKNNKIKNKWLNRKLTTCKGCI